MGVDTAIKAIGRLIRRSACAAWTRERIIEERDSGESGNAGREDTSSGQYVTYAETADLVPTFRVSRERSPRTTSFGTRWPPRVYLFRLVGARTSGAPSLRA